MKSLLLSGVLALSLLVTSQNSVALDEHNEFIVYSVRSTLNMGNPGEKTYKDYFINMGTRHGLNRGQKVEVIRRSASYDLEARRLHREVEFPIARLKIIHADESVSVARLEKMYPEENTPIILPRAVLIGDVISVPAAN